MKVIIRINAAPGYEDTVEDALGKLDAVLNLVREKEGNYDLAAVLEGNDADEISNVENAIRHESGVQGLEREIQPDANLLDRLKPS